MESVNILRVGGGGHCAAYSQRPGPWTARDRLFRGCKCRRDAGGGQERPCLSERLIESPFTLRSPSCACWNYPTIARPESIATPKPPALLSSFSLLVATPLCEAALCRMRMLLRVFFACSAPRHASRCGWASVCAEGNCTTPEHPQTLFLRWTAASGAPNLVKRLYVPSAPSPRLHPDAPWRSREWRRLLLFLRESTAAQASENAARSEAGGDVQHRNHELLPRHTNRGPRLPVDMFST
jgi:hypothetical protein